MGLPVPWTKRLLMKRPVGTAMEGRLPGSRRSEVNAAILRAWEDVVWRRESTVMERREIGEVEVPSRPSVR